MKKQDLKDLSIDELHSKLGEERASYTKLKLSHAVSPVENPLRIRDARRNIARFETELRTRKSQSTNQNTNNGE